MKRLKPDSRSVRAFKKTIWDYYHSHGREFPWRSTKEPYCILVSELMLQQTRTETVVPKYLAFIARFPNIDSLAEAPLSEVLGLWKGLGYNRRALQLKSLAEKLVLLHNGKLPKSVTELRALPGIGPYTSAAICNFAYNTPAVCIETNIRAVFMHFFFQGAEGVLDRDILPLVEDTLDQSNPREWYYALMDYGVKLKKEVPKLGRRSAHYFRQKPFKGSEREIRGLIIAALLKEKRITLQSLSSYLERERTELKGIVIKLEAEGFVRTTGRWLELSN